MPIECTGKSGNDGGSVRPSVPEIIARSAQWKFRSGWPLVDLSFQIDSIPPPRLQSPERVPCFTGCREVSPSRKPKSQAWIYNDFSGGFQNLMLPVATGSLFVLFSARSTRIFSDPSSFSVSVRIRSPFNGWVPPLDRRFSSPLYWNMTGPFVALGPRRNYVQGAFAWGHDRVCRRGDVQPLDGKTMGV